MLLIQIQEVVVLGMMLVVMVIIIVEGELLVLMLMVGITALEVDQIKEEMLLMLPQLIQQKFG
jgi:hypothetical protein